MSSVLMKSLTDPHTSVWVRYRSPHQALCRVVRCFGFSPNPAYRADHARHWRTVSAEQDCRWGAMTGNISARAIHHVCQVETRKHFLDQLRAKLSSS